MNERTSVAPVWHGTTIVSVRRHGRVVIAGDGQVTQGQTVMKPNARKVRTLGPDAKVIAEWKSPSAVAPSPIHEMAILSSPL